MKKSVVVFSFLVAILFLTAFQGKPKGYVIKGMIEGIPKDGWIYMTHEYNVPIVYYDSAQIKNGRFEFRGKVDVPELRYITYFKNPAQRIYYWDSIIMMPIFIENSEIQISVPYPELPTLAMLGEELPSVSLKIEGSRCHDLYTSFKKQEFPLILKLEEMRHVYFDAYFARGSDEDVYNSVRGMDAIRDSIYGLGIEFIRRHPESPVALYVAQNLSVASRGREEAKKVATLFHEKVKSTSKGQEMMKDLLEKPVYVGDVLPDFEVLNQDLQKMKLSELVKKGNYTLIDFWASWCGPCRESIPYLKNVYRRYHKDGFQIIGVSIDDDMNAWKNAVKEEKMEWTQVCGANGKGAHKECVKLFGFAGIPAYVLVDNEGRIISLNARDGQLITYLFDIYKH